MRALWTIALLLALSVVDRLAFSFVNEVRRLMELRRAVLIDPAAARASFCAAAAEPDLCDVALGARRHGRWQSACDLTPAELAPRRYYRLHLRCRVPFASFSLIDLSLLVIR